MAKEEENALPENSVLPKGSELDRLAKEAEEREHQETIPQAIRRYPKAIFWAFFVALTVVMEGYDAVLMGNFYAYPTFAKKYGTFNPNIHGSTTERYQISAAWQSGLGMASTVGGFFGAWLNGVLVDRWSKKRVLIGTLITLVGFIFIVFFAQNLTTLVVGEIFCGVCWGICGTLSPAYASEVMPLQLRVYLTSYNQLAIAFGQFITAGVLAGMVHVSGPWSYHGPFAIQWFWPLFLVPILAFAPDSPWDLVRKDRIEEAKDSIRRLHNANASEEEIESALSLIIFTNRQEQELNTVSLSYKQCFLGTDLRRTEIACMSIVGQVGMGVCILGSASYFFEQVGLDTNQIYTLNLGNNALGVVSLILFWIFLLPRYGRRTIYIGAGIVIFALLMIVGILQARSADGSVGMAQAVLFLLFTFVFQGTIAPLGWAIPAEVGSTRLRQKTVVVARNSYYICATVASVLMNYMRQSGPNDPLSASSTNVVVAVNPEAWNLAGYMTFVWAGTTFVMLFWAYFRLPETKDRSYEQLNLLFAKKVGARQFGKYEVDAFDMTDGDKVTAVHEENPC